MGDMGRKERVWEKGNKKGRKRNKKRWIGKKKKPRGREKRKSPDTAV
jgi:hypothetical protein